jgi:hypothetical protein
VTNLNVFRIIQIGDVHYSDRSNFDLPVDSKDPAFPLSVTESIGTPPLQAIFRNLAHILSVGPPDLVAFMGDFTTKGEATVLDGCLAYLRGLFPTAWTHSAPSCQLIIGNHDIDRSKDPESDKRFEDVNKAVTAAGFRAASITTPDEITFRKGHAEMRVYGLNSCRGCGQVRLLGPLLAKKAGPAIARLLSGGGDPDALDELYESIDTPSIDDSTLQELSQAVSAMDQNSLPIICAHHNLLPQETPRIAPYSELINAGSVRAALLNLGRPAIYLHGHLHEDPIEVVRAPAHPRAAIISISAPLMRDGYNEIEIAYSRDGIPLGCRVTPHRRKGGQIVRDPPYTIPVWTIAEGMKLASAESREVMRALEPDRFIARSDLLKTGTWTEEILDSALEELHWLGIVDIPNAARPSFHWRVVRSI